MDGIRAWSAALCVVALGCSAVQLLAPKVGTGRIFRLIVATFFICCMVMPMLTWRASVSLDIGSLPDEVRADLLEEEVNRQLTAQVEKTVDSLARETLSARGATAKKITVYTDTSERGGIYIEQVTITVDKQTVPIAKAAGEVLAEQLGATVTVESE